MKRFKYSHETADLKQSRARESWQHREFVAWKAAADHRLWVNSLSHPWSHYSLPFSHAYDAQKVAA